MNDTPANEDIVRPLKGKNAPNLGPVAVLVSDPHDLCLLCKLMNLPKDNYRNLFNSRLYLTDEDPAGFSIVGPLIGAPYATMLLETIVAWGARKILFFGWCGAVAPRVKIGDIIVPSAAFIDEGTSRHYNGDENFLARPSAQMLAKTKTALKEYDLSFHEGPVWSTDAVYRETRAKVEYFQQKDVLAVEMELSALFTVGRYRAVDVSGILVVSDEVSTFRWRPGFKEKDFKKGRQAVAEVISILCPKI